MRSRTYLKTEPKFVVNKKEKVVVCILNCDVNVDKTPDKGDYYYYAALKSNSPTFEVKGIARCSENDTFSEEIGKRVAESKAKKLAFIKAKEFYGKLLWHYSKVCAFLAEVSGNCAHAAVKEHDRIVNEEYLNNKKS